MAGTALAGAMLSALVDLNAKEEDARPRCATGASAVPV